MLNNDKKEAIKSLFMGTVLCELSSSDNNFVTMPDSKILEILRLANKCAAKVITRKGVISSTPNREELT
ncbi:hypothetical protein [Clostridium tyrobutyricum]|uniref:hypothetical protein n=1 Tax=Clostridium tyrobutyricum TaxID=1519 RepID=UPI00073D3A98|nr:hypothetical protein [Clostridium tyrobutyricum]